MDRTIFYLILRNLHCDDKEKENCLELIAALMKYVKKAKREGVLALEDDIETIDDIFLKKGFEFLTSCYDQYYLYNILMTMICTSRTTDLQILQKLIILEGIISIANNESEDLAAWRLTAVLGEGYKTKFMQYAVQL